MKNLCPLLALLAVVVVLVADASAHLKIATGSFALGALVAALAGAVLVLIVRGIGSQKAIAINESSVEPRFRRSASLQVGRMLLLGSSLIFICACQAARELRPSATSTPNLILIVVDALRVSNVSFLGYSRDTTPNLDVLAGESYVFDHAISVGGNTATAMSALMTGHYPFFSFEEKWTKPAFGMRRFYVDSSESGLPRSLKTLAEQLNAAGYNTAGFITNPHLKTNFNFHRGFDHYEEIFREKGIPYGKGEAVSQATTDFLHSSVARPFFLYLHYMDTHGPYSPPAPYHKEFIAKDQETGNASQLWKRWEKEIGLRESDAEDLAEYMRSLYDGTVAYVDDCIALIIRALEDLELIDDTVIAVTADHGDEFLEHGGTTHKGTLYDELVRVPLLIRIPGKEGGRIHDLVRNFDLMPTFLEIAGLDAKDQGLDAVSLLPLIDGKVQSLRLVAYAGFPSLRMLRTPNYKLLHFRNNRKEFYDLIKDPGEKQNLYPGLTTSSTASTAYSERMATMEKMLAQMEASFLLMQTTAESPATTEIDPVTEEQLRALGYLD